MTKPRVRSEEYKKRQLEQQLARRRANPEKYREMGKRSERRRRLKRYGITEDGYNEMYSSQEGKCKICFTELKDGRSSSIDHCHNSGIVRGLLCSHCNIMLGMAKDNCETLERAIKYLKGIL